MPRNRPTLQSENALKLQLDAATEALARQAAQTTIAEAERDRAIHDRDASEDESADHLKEIRDLVAERDAATRKVEKLTKIMDIDRVAFARSMWCVLAALGDVTMVERP